MYCTQTHTLHTHTARGSYNTTLWPECIAHKHTHTQHTALAYNTTLWPQCIAHKHTQTAHTHCVREDFITQRFGHNVLHPNTHTQR